MLPWILGIVAAIIVVFIVIVAMQPPTFRVTRSAVIAASPARVFEEVNDLHRWVAWSPWQKLDPNMTQTYDGPPAGVDSTMAWSGNNKAGQGRMTITESKPAERVGFRLEFLRPFRANHAADFTFEPVGGGGSETRVNWSMSGDKNFMSKAFGLIMNMDKLIGADFEKGLAQLKTIAEAK
jgi:uncharacterized protein YndB with AHSA1/START domain